MTERAGIWHGMPVLFDANMTEAKTEVIARTWRARMLSWPWRPWVTTETRTIRVPSRQVIQLQHKLLMHPDLWNEMKRALSQESSR